jgi:hypothetical protein
MTNGRAPIPLRSRPWPVNTRLGAAFALLLATAGASVTGSAATSAGSPQDHIANQLNADELRRLSVGYPAYRPAPGPPARPYAPPSSYPARPWYPPPPWYGPAPGWYPPPP